MRRYSSADAHPGGPRVDAQDAQVALLAQDGQRLLGEGRRDDDLVEGLGISSAVASVSSRLTATMPP